jgi:enediyne biosynthesis protein CalE5
MTRARLAATRGPAPSNTPAQHSQELRPRLRTLWSAVADAWAEHAEYADVRGAAITRAMLEGAAPQLGERVLELACGPGGLGLAAAELVGEHGEVVLSDLVPEMTAIAARRAAGRGLANVRTCELDLERIAQPDAAFDVVLCREGLMFVPDPESAVGEIRRVLRPGGRVALAVWASPDRNPWLAVVFDVVSAELGEPMPPPGVPGPFSLADPHRLTGMLADAGLVDIVLAHASAPIHAASIDEWWTRTAALAGPLALRLKTLSAEAAAALRCRVDVAVAPYLTPTGLHLPGVSLVASARCP